MITTLTLSPCIDKTVTLQNFDPDRVNRAESIRLDAGGKGINVSIALAALGVKSNSVMLGFEGSQMIFDTLDEYGIGHDHVRCHGRLRTNLKIFDTATGKTIELNEQNPEVSPEAVEKVIELCRQRAELSDIFVLSGSIPPGMPEDIYRSIAEAVKQTSPKIKVVLDAVGKPFLEGLRAAPYLIKPNVEELERSFGVTLKGDNETVALCKKIIADYSVNVVLVSMGAEGALIVTKDEEFKADALKIEPKSAQGAGDAMVAGACFAISQGLTVENVLKYGTCSAAGAVEREGTAFCDLKRFEELLSKF